MRKFQVLVCALALAACGDDGGAVDSGDGQVSEELADHCIATFTADHDLRDIFGDVALRVEQGQRYLLTGLPNAPALVYQHRDGAFELDLDDDAPVDAPCLAAGAALDAEHVAFARLDVYADQALQDRVCTIERFARSSVGIGYGYVADDVYQLTLGGELCDGLESGYVRATRITVGTASYTGVPILRLFTLQD